MKNREGLYEKSPVALQHVLTSLQGSVFRFKRANTAIIQEQFTFLKESQFWSEREHRAYQHERLMRILDEAYSHVPYYKGDERYNPKKLKSLDHIQDLPILTKDDLRGQENLFISERANVRSLYHNRTSGTTGKPLNTYESQESFSRRFAFIVRLRYWAGIQNPIYPRRFQFTGRKVVPPGQGKNTHVYWRRNAFQNSMLASVIHINRDTVAHYIEFLKRYQPELMDGYPSSFLVLARLAKLEGLDPYIPKAIITTAETLTAQAESEIEEYYRSPIFNQYSSSEPTCFWCTTPSGVMVANPEYGISEIVNREGTPVPVGEIGEVVTTSFLNPVMPLIRYRVGDVASLGNYVTVSGINMQEVLSVDGRRDDMIFTPERGYIGRCDDIFKGLKGIIESQIVQHNSTDFSINVVRDPGYDYTVEMELLQNAARKFGESVTINIKYLDSIEKGANGKFKSVISNYKDEITR